MRTLTATRKYLARKPVKVTDLNLVGIVFTFCSLNCAFLILRFCFCLSFSFPIWFRASLTFCNDFSLLELKVTSSGAASLSLSSCSLIDPTMFQWASPGTVVPMYNWTTRRRNISIFTGRNSSCGKVMFSQTCVYSREVGYLWSHVPSGGYTGGGQDIQGVRVWSRG